ncbi:class I SAM-dependent methyltransferase [Alicyclobacillus sp. TC]|uniref:16S rRNA (Guanine1207-N2)-methyltransferase n=1 Tax=Alicyclobacillus tolerans TaxID=90970 RepID=A0ABT9LW39_9BACL|nr:MULTISPECIES: methyltransferase [Alicyclobacillus]MDP9728493.1 16S rRNA (guanine1207-N2)-methyltransferase [Alicyclobacillus tengchongensis]QRF22494.1 class I SAM-dependent methyltransferase [Alicyclobacillus sp. TC]
MTQYFDKQPDVPSHKQKIVFHVRGRTYSLWTDSGVFSKRGLDFGTRLLIESAELQNARNALDLGCGYGPVVAVLADLFPEVRWLAVDVNERAVELAKENTSHLAQVHCKVSDGYAEISSETFDAILLNPPIRAGKKVVYSLFENSLHHLSNHGILWVVMAKKQGMESAEKFLKNLFRSVIRVAHDGGYTVLSCQK